MVGMTDRLLRVDGMGELGRDNRSSTEHSTHMSGVRLELAYPFFRVSLEMPSSLSV